MQTATDTFNGNRYLGALNVGLTFDMRRASSTAVQAVFDEYRVGATLNDVMPLIPEPGSISLLALGGLSLMAFCRRRRMP